MELGGISAQHSVSANGSVLTVSGILDESNAASLAVLFGSHAGVDVLELAELDLDGSAATLAAVDAVRRLLEASGRLTLYNSPQILAHTLYRVGLLETGTLELRDTRQEEPYG
jgi:anti-anti-sigma regulatory factor